MSTEETKITTSDEPDLEGTLHYWETFGAADSGVNGEEAMKIVRYALGLKQRLEETETMLGTMAGALDDIRYNFDCKCSDKDPDCQACIADETSIKLAKYREKK